MVSAVIFDVDGTLVDSVDFHAAAWHRAFAHFRHPVTFEQARSQIGKGGDKLMAAFLSNEEQAEQGKALETWRSELFRAEYRALVRPFAGVPDLFGRLRAGGIRTAVASSAKSADLDHYLALAGIAELIDARTCADDVERSKPEPDVFHAAREKLGIDPAEILVVGDTPYDAEAAVRAGLRPIGVLAGGFREADLRSAGCIDVVPSVATLFVTYEESAFTRPV